MEVPDDTNTLPVCPDCGERHPGYVEQLPRNLTEVQEAEQEFFDKLWYYRSTAPRHDGTVDMHPEVEQARARVRARYDPEELAPYDAFELAVICGKLAALRWMLGGEWDDPLDT